MFTKEEVKGFIIKQGNKWLFPDFHNKVTWYVVTLGAGVILAPTPLKIVFYNWLIDSFSLNSGINMSIADMGETSADYSLGFGLILSALLHNIFSKWLIHQRAITNNLEKEKIYSVDSVLFQKFITLLPTNSIAIKLLEEHDFENTFDFEYLSNLHTFLYLWNCPEKSFLTKELELRKILLWNKAQEFSHLLGRKSTPTGSGRQSVVPDENRKDWNRPKNVDDNVKAVNKMATEVLELHQDFVKVVRQVLKC